MTLIWFVIWLIAQRRRLGGDEPLIVNPVNGWTATLILDVALDLSASHARAQRGQVTFLAPGMAPEGVEWARSPAITGERPKRSAES